MPPDNENKVDVFVSTDDAEIEKKIDDFIKSIKDTQKSESESGSMKLAGSFSRHSKWVW